MQTCAAAVNDDLAWVDELQALQDSHTACSAASRARLVESKKLDSSMKKNTAAIRKLKTLQEGNAAQIMADLDTVNQTKVCMDVWMCRWICRCTGACCCWFIESWCVCVCVVCST